MLAIDTDVLAIHQFIRRDRRATDTVTFVQQTAQRPRGVSIYNLLELCGLAESHGQSGRKVFQQYATASDIEVLYPPVVLTSIEDYWQTHNESLFSRIERGMRLGEAVILWVVETCGCEALVTWNTRHFAGKTDLLVITPAEWLERFAEE